MNPPSSPAPSLAATTAERAAERTHLPHLDALRGIAILMVVCFHAFGFIPKTAGQQLFNQFLSTLSQGVPLFFVLSGFLISLIVFDERKPFSWHTYGMRRFAKIFPPFFLSLLFFAVRDLRHFSLPVIVEQLAANMFTLPNLLQHYPALNPVSWSLFVEVHFYLLLPLLFLGWKRLFPKKAEVLTIATFALVPVCFRLSVWNTPVANVAERFFLLCRFPGTMDYFAWGMLFCFFFRHHRKRVGFEELSKRLGFAGLLLLPVFVGLFTGLLSLLGVMSTQDRSGLSELCRFFICLTAFLLLFGGTIQSPPKAINHRFLRYIGLISYELFLFHAGVIPWLRYQICRALHWPHDPVGADGLVAFWSGASFFSVTLFAAAASVGLAALIYHFFSQPLLKLLRKY